ncbi:right-handed parallel beta-helix repeat-containing protein [Nostoc sp.]|uniref:right-handed parallel beta-helix repeat-containing protein n=1 Tax=Nostoc sp. TaxID=1180 RepID=UPI003593AC2C
MLPWALTGLVEGKRITESLVRDIRPSSSVQEMPLPSRKLISQASSCPTQTTKIYYVNAGEGNDGDSGTSVKDAFKTIQRAADITCPGDTVRIMAGTYKNEYPTGSVVHIKRSGRVGKWIRYEAYPGHRPKLQLNGWHGILLSNNISYILIKGLEIEGNNKNITLSYAMSQRYNDSNPLTNGNCISLDGRKNVNGRPNHIVIRNNIIHDCGGAGISIIASDYVTVDNNEVFNNAWYSVYSASGISLLKNWGSDNNRNYKMFITSNKIYNNKMLVPDLSTGKIQDGNGIIIDRSRNDEKGSKMSAYGGRTLIANNISYKNGGTGIHTFKSDHVDIVYNTVYLNNQTPGFTDGQIMTNTSANVKVLNNILFGERGKPINSKGGSKNVTFNYNHNANSTFIRASGPNDTSGDPLFVNPSAGDFRLKSNSPAINTGTRFNSVKTDFLGNPREQGLAPDRGALERR